MFKCERCKGISDPMEKPVRIVVETREKVYPLRRALPADGRPIYNEEDWPVIDNGGKGTEIVKEMTVHKACAAAPF